MKTVITILIVGILMIASCSDSNNDINRDLTRRIMILEAYHSDGVYVRDSIIEYYTDRMMIKVDHYITPDRGEAPYELYGDILYDDQNRMSGVVRYRDVSRTEEYQTVSYEYDTDGRIQRVNFHKYAPSDFSDNLFNNSTIYEYHMDTIKTHSIDHLNGDVRTDKESYVVTGDIESIKALNGNYIYRFDNQNDLYEYRVLSDSTTIYLSFGTDVKYGKVRTPLIENGFGSTLNLFLLNAPTEYYRFELGSRQVSEYYYKGERADNFRSFEYHYDEEDRLTHVSIGNSSFAANPRIRYYYD